MFFKSLKENKKRGLTAIHLRKDGVAIAQSRSSGRLRKLSKAFFVPLTDPEVDSNQVKEALAKAELENTHCSLVLSPDEYQVLLVEAPDVAEDEMADALRWRVNDLISQDAESVVLDYIDLPPDAYRQQRTMLYVFIADRALIDKRVAWLESLSLVPVFIDVPEMALLNVTAAVAEGESGLLTLTTTDRNVLISILSSGSLYTIRSMALDMNHIDSMLLNLQRSLDFYESQIGKPPCARLLILPLQLGETELLTTLRDNLSVDVGSFDLGEFIESEVPLSIELQQQALLSIAGALRPVQPMAKGRNG